MEHLLFLLLFITKLPGGDSMQTQSRVSAQKGGSVTIACRYDQKYKGNVKYWCRGLGWHTCIVLLSTDSPQGRADLSITDDPAQQVVTVTMRNLQLWNSNKYWCAVKIKGIGTPDDKAGVYLSVTKEPPPQPGTPPGNPQPGTPPGTTPQSGTPPSDLFTGKASTASPSTPKGGVSMQTQSRVSAQKGGSVTIACRYDQKYKDNVKYWCRGLGWHTCIVLLSTDSPQGRADLSITDDPAQQVVTVTMRNLQLWNSNKYWCAVKIKGIGTPDDKAGVYLSVTKAELSTLFTLASMAPPSALPNTARSTARAAPPATTSSLLWWQSLLIACGVMLLVTTVAMVTWKTCRQRRNSYIRCEMDQFDSELMLHTEHDNDRIQLFLRSSSQHEHPF
ncbi:hypothetical protein SKAU_G00076300 [Synaphobranchus kaupii]|uniref:Ig-like domain-containing protein n=1 Tax=Synaphobranchus kaupii TaxID=118154 RepID=A0A9Q1G7Y2_SYNKA|nr:hypothetical protein SKAU_G00076300 [Synaphobranchus kaupii]